MPRISAPLSGPGRGLRIRLRGVALAVALGELVDVAGDDSALGAPDLALVLCLRPRCHAGYVHAFSLSLEVLYDGRRTLAGFDDHRTSAGSGFRPRLRRTRPRPRGRSRRSRCPGPVPPAPRPRSPARPHRDGPGPARARGGIRLRTR